MNQKKIKILLSILSFIFLFASIPTAHAALCKVGDKASVLWGGKRWPATVIAVNKKGTKCKIHYKGYGRQWDEWVGDDRITILKSSSTSAKKGSYSVGQAVKAKWGKKWWNAHVLKVSGKRYYIHYDGYGKKWDEWVGLGRIKPR